MSIQTDFFVFNLKNLTAYQNKDSTVGSMECSFEWNVKSQFDVWFCKKVNGVCNSMQHSVTLSSGINISNSMVRNFDSIPHFQNQVLD